MTLILRTRRLRGERLQARDLPDLIDLHLDDEVMRHLGGVRSPEDTAGYLAVNVDHWDRYGFGLWGVRLLDGQTASSQDGSASDTSRSAELLKSRSHTPSGAPYGAGI